jgi:hypothetical protein
VLPVMVGNPSFEITVQGSYHNNGWNTLPQPGAWVGGGTAFDTLNPALGGHFSQVPDGTNCCYLVQTGPISQDLHITNNAGQTVTLAFYEGRANDNLGASVSSLSATIKVGTQSFTTNFNDSTVGSGAWALRSFFWTAPTGGDLQIAFTNLANNSFLDNVSVSVTPLRPKLGIGLLNSNMLVSWGLEGEGFNLYSSTNLLQWTPETPVLATNLQGISTLLPVGHPMEFFRLQK